MQQVTQKRELPERMSWARAMIFAIGFFLLSAILVGQIPGYVYNAMTASSLVEFERGAFSLGLICLACFAVIMVIEFLFDPKPVVPPAMLAGVGSIIAVVGLAVTAVVSLTGYQSFPSEKTNLLSVLGGKFLWFQANAIDLVAVGLVILFVGLATVFYSVLAMGEQRNPDRRDLGTTPVIRVGLIISSLLLIVFVYSYNYNPFPASIQPLVLNVILGVAVFLALGAFALRLHYLMRPVRKNVMSGLYAVGALGLAQTGALFIVLWLVAYPLLALLHPLPVLGPYLTNCTRATAIPTSCSFSQDAGYLIDAIISSSFFGALLAAIWAWKSNRNLVVVGSVVITAVIALTALVLHTSATALPTAMMLCAAILVLATVWSMTARREFAVVGEGNLGCLGQWLIMGTCLFVYLSAFAFFSMANFAAEETPPNIPNPINTAGSTDSFVMFALFAVLGAIQFFFLARNRYRV
ncbi:hypothetical protein [Dictyobacter formicarum]|uniref:DUF998 domain-containing protein n=1 Tax=Dictyobacter formicarum TaxID=2778368 RepID=A0ABQ3VPU2_9CHLR|nr:hypothetical protein [Dictyobacter formicarum]GHO88120.1 hypothetical protein KSZ_61260 [Dictyobacter formicarum]